MKTEDKLIVTALIIVMGFLSGLYAVRYTDRQFKALREELNPPVNSEAYFTQQLKKYEDQALIDGAKPENQEIENDEVAADYENQIKECKAEIKSLKAKLKKKK